MENKSFVTKEQNVSNNLANQFRCPRRCIRVEILYQLSVQRNDLEFSDVFLYFNSFPLLILCSFNPFQGGRMGVGVVRWQNPQLLNLNRAHHQVSGHFWSNSYKIEVITSLIEMLELPNFGHMITPKYNLRHVITFCW